MNQSKVTDESVIEVKKKKKKKNTVSFLSENKKKF